MRLPFSLLLTDPGSQRPLWAPSLDSVILRDEVPPPALALRGPTWPSGADSRLAESPAAPAEGHACGGTRRTPRPGRARQPDLFPLKGRGPDGGVAPELRGFPYERRALTVGPAALGAPGDQNGRCSMAGVLWLRGGTSPPSMAPELAPVHGACVRCCGWGGAWRQTGVTGCQL